MRCVVCWINGNRAAGAIIAAVLAMAVAATTAGCSSLPFQPVPLIGEGPPPGYIGGNIPSSYAGMRSPYAPGDATVLAAGARVYISFKISCASCHGEEGRGDGPMAAFLDWGPADFSAPPMQTAFRDHQDYAFWWISEGVTKTQMPNHGDRLTPEEIWQVISYARSLGEKAASQPSSNSRQTTGSRYRR